MKSVNERACKSFVKKAAFVLSLLVLAAIFVVCGRWKLKLSEILSCAEVRPMVWVNKSESRYRSVFEVKSEFDISEG